MAQAMLKRKAFMNKKSEEEGSVEDLKKHINVDLLATVYPLNSSCTKKIVVGLHYDEETKSFRPLIQLCNAHYTHGLHITFPAWTELQNLFNDIDQYFDFDDHRRNVTFSPLKLDNMEVLFTTSFGTKSIVFDRMKVPGSENLSKRRKTHTPAIVMQKRTFNGLKRSVPCVNEHLKRLNRIVALVNMCKEFIKKEILLFTKDLSLTTEGTEAIISRILTDQSVLIREKLKNEIESSTDRIFVDEYFDIVYVELISMYYQIFSSELVNEIVSSTNDDDRLPNVM